MTTNAIATVPVRPVTEKMLAVLKDGDLSKLSDEEKLIYYVHECNRMGLDPAARPLEFMRLNGREVLYAKRVAGDMLAAKHGITTAIVEGPKVMEFGSAAVLYCRVRAAMPDGRSCEDVGTAAVADLVNAILKVVTKSIRRATLRLCGWGGLDESELESIPAHEKAAVEMPRLATVIADVASPDDGPPADGAPDPLAPIRAATADGPGSLTVDRAVAVYLAHETALGSELASTAFAMLGRACPAGTSKAAFKRAISAVQYERYYAAARSLDEVEAIDAEVAALRLPRESAERVRLVAARTAALARLRGPDGGGGGKPTGGARADDVVDAELDALEHVPADAAGEPSAVAEWRAHMEAKTDVFAVRGSVAKHAPRHRQLGCADACLRIAVERVMALSGHDSEMSALNFLRGPAARKAA